MDAAPSGAWRLIEDPPADGFRNMALDEALLDSCAGGGEGFPVLRLYAFAPPCLTLGFSQEHAAAADFPFCRDHGIDVVRRPTGGRAVLHDAEVTYSVVASRALPPFDGSLLDVYRAVSRGLIAGFARLGIAAAIAERARSTGSPRSGALCFAEPSRHEIVAGGRKIAGSSQARRRAAFLQHGSIPIRFDADLLARATGATRIPGGASPATEVPGLESLLGRAPAALAISVALREGFAMTFEAHLRRGEATRAERERAEWLRAHRYLTAAWTLRR